MNRLVRDVGFLCVGFGLAWGIFSWRFTHASPRVATVNGETITQGEFYAALRLAGGDEVLTHLVEAKAILHAADEQHLAVDAKTLSDTLTTEAKETTDPDVKQFATDEARAHLLLPKLVLKSVDDAARHKFYDAFKADLAEYDMELIAPQTPEDAKAIELDLKGGKSFEDVVGTYPSTITTDHKANLGHASAADVRAKFGSQVLDQLRQMKPGEVSPRLAGPGGPMWIKLIAVHDSYDDVKNEIDEIMANAGKNETLDRLVAEATIDSPFISPSAQPSASPSAGPVSSCDTP